MYGIKFILSAAFSDGMLDEAGTICLNMERFIFQGFYLNFKSTFNDF